MSPSQRAEHLFNEAKKAGMINLVTGDGAPSIAMTADAIHDAEADGYANGSGDEFQMSIKAHDELTALRTALKRAEKYKERLDWLHTCTSNDKDPEGYEWGVARLKFNEHGQLVSALWTNSDHSDLDAEMARCAALNDERKKV